MRDFIDPKLVSDRLREILVIWFRIMAHYGKRAWADSLNFSHNSYAKDSTWKASEKYSLNTLYSTSMVSSARRS